MFDKIKEILKKDKEISLLLWWRVYWNNAYWYEDEIRDKPYLIYTEWYNDDEIENSFWEYELSLDFDLQLYIPNKDAWDTYVSYIAKKIRRLLLQEKDIFVTWIERPISLSEIEYVLITINWRWFDCNICTL